MIFDTIAPGNWTTNAIGAMYSGIGSVFYCQNRNNNKSTAPAGATQNGADGLRVCVCAQTFAGKSTTTIYNKIYPFYLLFISFLRHSRWISERTRHRIGPIVSSRKWQKPIKLDKVGYSTISAHNRYYNVHIARIVYQFDKMARRWTSEYNWTFNPILFMYYITLRCRNRHSKQIKMTRN